MPRAVGPPGRNAAGAGSGSRMPRTHAAGIRQQIGGINMSAKLCEIEEAKETRIHQSETAFGCPRDFLGNRFVYVVTSARAHGLSIGLNMNPDKLCNFDCIYCEVNRAIPPLEQELDVCV